MRCQPDIHELRVWQKDWREENENINSKVNTFWAKQMPDGDNGDVTADSQMAPLPSPPQTPPTTEASSEPQTDTQLAPEDQQQSEGTQQQTEGTTEQDAIQEQVIGQDNVEAEAE